MIIKYCSKCGKSMIYNGHSMCNECQQIYSKPQKDKEYNKFRRNKKTDKFYHSKEWKELSKYILIKANYICADCGGFATEVHHEKEVSMHWEERFNPNNLVPLCTSCHNRRR